MIAAILINVIICCVGIFMCLCRVGNFPGNKMRGIVKLQYILTATAFMGLMWSPPAPHIITIASVLLILLLITLPRWQNGPPRESYKRHFVNSPHTDHVISMQRRG